MSADVAATRHWGLWSTVAWSAFIGAVFVFGQVLVVTLHIHQAGMSPGDVERMFGAGGANGWLVAISTLTTTTVCCALIAGVVKMKRGATLREYLALHTVSPATLAKWLGTLAILIAASDLLTWALGRPIVPEFMSRSYATAEPLWLFCIALIVFAPLFEEAFFRGFLFRGLAASAVGPIGAIVLTTTLWAMLHVQYDTYGIATIFVLGLFFGAARVATGSLYVPLALHAVANLVATIETAIAAR